MHRYTAFLLLPLAAIAAFLAKAPRPALAPLPVPALTAKALEERLETARAGSDQDKLVQACNDLLLAEPTHYRAQMVLAGLHFARHDYRRSAGDYARVLMTCPHDADALSGAAWSAIHLGDLERAKSDVATLLALQPGYPHAQLACDIALGKQRQTEEVPLATSLSKPQER